MEVDRNVAHVTIRSFISLSRHDGRNWWKIQQIVAQWWRSGGAVVAQWWRSGGAVVAQWWRSGGAVVAQWWRSGGAVVRALASHQCGPGSIPGPGVICGLSLLLVLSLLQGQGLSSGYSGISFSSKTNTAKFQFDPECTDTCWTSSWALFRCSVGK